MARNATWSLAARNAKLDAIRASLNSGYLRYYDGAQPAGPDTAIGAQVLLAELRFNAVAFPAAAGGVLTANAITSDPSANATGNATWYRALQSDGTTAVHDGTVGTSNANAIVASTSITAGLPVDCASFSITDAPASAL